MTNALIVVDVQKDFVEGGSLAVAGGQQVADNLENAVIPVFDKLDHLVLYTKDWHDPDSDNGGHISSTPDYIDSWPAHCVAGSEGAAFAGNFSDEAHGYIFYKGMGKPSYSGAEGVNPAGTSLIETLRYFEIDTVDVVGIAYDYCVKATALDLVDAGFKVNVIKDFTASVHPENDEDTTFDLESRGVSVYDGRKWVQADGRNRKQKQAGKKDPGNLKVKK